MFKKIAIGITVLLLLLVVSAVAIPFVFKDRLIEAIRLEVNKQLKADIDYSSIDVAVFRSFPLLSAEMNDLTIVNKDTFFYPDTLARCKKLNIGIDVLVFLKEYKLDIKSVSLEEPIVHAMTVATPKGSLSNFDIFPTNDDGEIENQSEQLSFNVEKLLIANGYFFLEDEPSALELSVENLYTDGIVKYNKASTAFEGDVQTDSLRLVNGGTIVNADNLFLNVEGDFTDAVTDWLANVSSGSLSFADGSSHLSAEDAEWLIEGTLKGDSLISTNTLINNQFSFRENDNNYLSNAKLKTVVNVNADLHEQHYELTNNEIHVNSLSLFADGDLNLLEDGVNMDLDLATNQASFAEFISLIPAEYLKDINTLDASGDFQLNAKVKGDYSYDNIPAVDATVNVAGGSMKYDDIPVTLNDLNLTAYVKTAADNPNQLSVNIPTTTFKVDDEPVEMSLDATDVLGDPYIDTKVKGLLSLEKIQTFFPLDDVETLSGSIDTDIAFKGKVSAVEEEKYQEIDLVGKINAQNIAYKTADLPVDVSIKTMDLDFSPAYANLSNLDAQLGNSDIKGNGKVENVLNYLFNDGILKGDVAIQSNYLDLSELMTSSEIEENETATSNIDMPKNIALDMNADIKEVLYDGITLKNIKGNATLANETLMLESMKGNLLGGNAVINGSYSTKGEGKPVLDFTYDINSFSIQETFQYLNTFQKLAPLAKYMTGTFNSEMTFNSLMNDGLAIDLAALNGLGNVRIPYATFTDLPMIEQTLNVVKIPGLNGKPAVSDAWTVLKFRDGNVDVEPFDVKMGDLVMNIGGSNGLDESINYQIKLDVPSDKFGGAASLANNFLSQQKIPLLDLAVPQSITFHLNVTGFLKNPKVAIAKVTSSKNGGSIKENIKEQVEDAKDKAKEEAQAAIDRAKAEAERAKQEALDKAKAEAEKAKQEALDKAKEEADKAKEDIKDKIKDKFPGFGF